MNALIQRLHEKQIYIGTSSWRYPGWQGWFYRRAYRTAKDFNQNCLNEYAENFPTVGVDHTYYDWPSEAMFRGYVEQTPETFRFGLKVTERVTVLRFPRLPRYGKDSGKDNPGFLDASLFREKFLRPLDAIAQRIGPVMLEFSQFYPGMLDSGREFVARLDTFFSQLESEKAFRFAVEIRNQNWLKQPYFELLAKHGVAHVFNSWTRMPSLSEQLKLAGSHALPFLVSRVLLQPGTKYEEAVEAFAPYDKLMEEQPALRQSVADLILRAVELKLPAYVFVNNRAEGCSPRTIEAILQILQQRGLFD